MKIFLIMLTLMSLVFSNADVKVTKITKTIERVDGNVTQQPQVIYINLSLKNSNKCKIYIK